MQWGRISILLSAISSDLEEQGFFMIEPQNSKPRSFQKSVVRTNCMDCLDRTNVVQSVIAKHMLKRQLSALNIMSMEDYCPYLDSVFQNGKEKYFLIIFSVGGQCGYY